MPSWRAPTLRGFNGQHSAGPPCPLLAQSRHKLVHCKCPLLGVKRTLFAEMPAGQALPAFFEPQKRAGVIKQAILQKAPVLCAPACHTLAVVLGPLAERNSELPKRRTSSAQFPASMCRPSHSNDRTDAKPRLVNQRGTPHAENKTRNNHARGGCCCC
jgi:hypothetical protein